MRRYLRSLISVGAAQVAVGLLSVAVIPIGVARLGVTGYGLFSVFLIVSAFLALLDPAISKPLVRALSAGRSTASRSDQVRVAGGLYCYFAVLLCVGLAVTYPWLQPALFPVQDAYLATLRILFILAVCEYLSGAPLVLLQSQNMALQQFNVYARLNLLLGVTRYLFMLGAFLLLEDITLIALTVVLRRIVELPLCFTLARRYRLSLGAPIVELNSVGSFAREVTTAGFSQSAYSALLASGSVMVTHLGGLDALGVYRLAYDLTNRVWLLASIVAVIAFPAFAKHLTTGRIDPVIAVRRLSLAWALYLGLAAGGIVIMGPLLSLLALDHPGVLSVSTLLLIGMTISAYAYIGIDFMGAGGHFTRLGLVHLAGLSIFASISVSAWSAWGLNAIGLGWIVSQGVATLLLDYNLLRTIGAKPAVQAGYALGKLGSGALVSFAAISVIATGSATPASVTIAMLLAVCVVWLAAKALRE